MPKENELQKELLSIKTTSRKQLIILDKKLDLSDGLVDVTDPCYEDDVWCRINDVPVKPGLYTCYYIFDMNERRIISSGIVHESFDVTETIKKRHLHRDGTVGVDAGLAGYFVSPKPDYNMEEWHELCSKIGNSNHYQDDTGFFTSSGYGDGFYDLQTYSKDKQIVSLKIKFM